MVSVADSARNLAFILLVVCLTGWLLWIGSAVLWPIFAAILSAYILTGAAEFMNRVPVLKLAVLTYLLITVRFGGRRSARDRTKLYRIIEVIGPWSMVDVFMIALLAALVDLGQIATIEPGPGALAFASVVILTMFAAMRFDPRLIWDAEDLGENDRV